MICDFIQRKRKREEGKKENEEKKEHKTKNCRKPRWRELVESGGQLYTRLC